MILDWRTDNPPEEKSTYLVTDDSGHLQIAIWTNEMHFGRTFICDWHWQCQQYTHVVAWLPLPRPYKVTE